MNWGKIAVTALIWFVIPGLMHGLRHVLGWSEFREGNAAGYAWAFALLLRHPGLFGLSYRKEPSV